MIHFDFSVTKKRNSGNGRSHVMDLGNSQELTTLLEKIIRKALD